MEDQGRYWFPAKRYGWGWGLPSRPEGWLVLIFYAVLMFLSYDAFLPDDPGFFGLSVAVLTGLLLTTCWVKGEPPRWRWGSDD